ncbi:hypothetical protein AB0L06_41965 [Spirillospora sp. NPDC052269]
MAGIALAATFLAGCGSDNQRPTVGKAKSSPPQLTAKPTIDPSGRPPQKAALLAKLKSDPYNQALSASFLSCYGNWLFAYIKPSTLGAYVEGKMSLQDIGGAKSLRRVNSPKASTDLSKCIEKIHKK